MASNSPSTSSSPTPVHPSGGYREPSESSSEFVSPHLLGGRAADSESRPVRSVFPSSTRGSGHVNGNDAREPLLCNSDIKGGIVNDDYSERVVTFSESVNGHEESKTIEKYRDGRAEVSLEEQMMQYEALNYTLEEPDLKISGAFQKTRLSLEEEQRSINRQRWGLTFVIAIFTALVAVLITWATQTLVKYKLKTAQDWIMKEHHGEIPHGFTLLLMVGMCLGMSMIGGLFVMLEPIAAGSGISEIKSLLNGVMIKRSMRIKTLIAKAGGLIFAVGGGFPIGKEGPMIHADHI
eukprot:jgi/Bigna1/81150/fgenesh1_pg.77_\